jgi:hypothetical protein
MVLADLKLLRHSGAHVELRSSTFEITAQRPDFEQDEPPGRITVYLSAEIDRQAFADSDDVELRLPAAVVIDTGIDQVRLDRQAARALVNAVTALTEAP